MRRFKRKINIVEISRKTRVRMHKSGKNWVRTIFASIQTKSLNFINNKLVSNQQSNWVRNDTYNKSAALLGVIIGGCAEAGIVMAEEIVVSETNQTVLATTDSVAMSTTSSAVASHSAEIDSVSLANSLSESLGNSVAQSESISMSTSQSVSEVISSSESVSESESISESLSYSTFASESATISSIESLSTSLSDTITSSNIVHSSTVSPSIQSNSESDLEDGKQSEMTSESVSKNVTSEYLTATSKSLDTSRFHLAVSALQVAMDHHLPDTIETSSTRYQRYLEAKQGADDALVLVNQVLKEGVDEQDQLDAISMRIAQAANNLTGRLKQLLPSTVKVGSQLRASSSILVFSESDYSAKYRDRQISLVEGRLDTTTNLIEWTVTYQPVQSLTEAYAGLYVAAVTEMGPPQNLQVNGIPLLLDTSIRNRETLGTNLSTTDYTGRFYGNNYSLGMDKVNLSGPITYTFSTRVGSSLANIALYVQAALHPTDSNVHATYNEANGRTNLSGMLIGYKASFVADSMNSFLQSTSESIQNSLSIRQSISQSQSLSVSESRSVSQSQS